MKNTFKVYIKDKKTLDSICKDYSLELDYLSKASPAGYVSDGKFLRVFCHNSHVDLSPDTKDITDTYKTKEHFYL